MKNCILEIKTLSVFNLPFPDISFFSIEINTDFHELSVVCHVWNQIAPVVDLLKGLFRATVQFEFKYIDVFGSFDHGISPSGGTTCFSLLMCALNNSRGLVVN